MEGKVTEARSEGRMLDFRVLTASSRRINPLFNPLGALLRSQINPARV